MTFQPGFSPVFSRPFAQAAAAVVVANWWLSGGVSAGDCVAAYQAKGAASLAVSYVNLNAPGTYDITTPNAPTWNSTDGWIFNGIAQYLETAIVNSSGWSAIVRYTNATGNAPLFCSESTGTIRFNIFPTFSGTTIFYQNGGFSTSTALTAGVLAIAGQQGYKNGVADGATISAWSGTNTESIRIAKAGTAASFSNSRIQAIAIYSTTITAAQVLAITSAMQAL